MHTRVKQFALLGLILFFPFLSSSATANNKIKVVASFSILADLVENVGGDHISMTTLVGPNASIHTYEPTPRDVKVLRDAHIIFVNGLHLEDSINRLIAASDTKALLIEASANIPALTLKDQEHGTKHHHHHNSIDPHAWQAISNVKIYIKNIAVAFCTIDHQSCESYNKNADAYLQKLDTLQTAITTQIATIPQDKRIIITSHDAFNYFAHEYDFTILAPQSISTETEATAADVASLIKQIKANKASALFVENISNPRLIEQIAKETNLKIGGTLYSDALSEKNGPAATYLSMMQYNVNTIINAIQTTQIINN
ncbi:metal ABC transporter solute-binding protein, Zn/Mn family [Bartonella schoenbuchensis]|uniref:ABC transporter, periplasmic binding protein n=1 Tax=Bartonella schoenbuchensis m07a TaxID=1094496 RepID=N6UMG4_9HYPH|nr:zinc ABC transporter substrate-binding protein [Bartonella schoenbuchensis]ENN91403.1 ABC transporter, periplasmic binding protein [Bartonella schoenbuchensis m07a]